MVQLFFIVFEICKYRKIPQLNGHFEIVWFQMLIRVGLLPDITEHLYLLITKRSFVYSN